MRINFTYTITAGTPIHVLSGQTTAAAVKAAFQGPIWASRITYQNREGSTGLIYVMEGVRGVDTATPPLPRIPAATNSGDLTRVLSIPLSAGQPGGEFTDTSSPFYGESGADIDAWQIWVDGSHTGDKVTISLDIHPR